MIQAVPQKLTFDYFSLGGVNRYEALVRIGCEHAVRLHCRGRHIRVYLNAVRLLVTAHWKQHLEKESK
jgi:hypothetical protein